MPVAAVAVMHELLPLPATLDELAERLETVHRVVVEQDIGRLNGVYQDREKAGDLETRAVRAALQAAVEHLGHDDHRLAPEPVDLRAALPTTCLTGTTAVHEGQPVPPAAAERDGPGAV